MFFMTRKLGWNIDQPKEPEMFYIERYPGETRAEFEVRRRQEWSETLNEPSMTGKIDWDDAAKKPRMEISPLVFTLTCKPSPDGKGLVLGISDMSLTTLHYIPVLDDVSIRAALEKASGVPASAIDLDGLCAGIAAMSDEQPTEPHNMDTPANKSAKETIDHITGGRVHPEIRTKLRGALDKADAPPAGREKSDGAVGRAIRLDGA